MDLLQHALQEVFFDLLMDTSTQQLLLITPATQPTQSTYQQRAYQSQKGVRSPPARVPTVFCDH